MQLRPLLLRRRYVTTTPRGPLGIAGALTVALAACDAPETETTVLAWDAPPAAPDAPPAEDAPPRSFDAGQLADQMLDAGPGMAAEAGPEPMFDAAHADGAHVDAGTRDATMPDAATADASGDDTSESADAGWEAGQPAACSDADLDGVCDDQDLCPDANDAHATLDVDADGTPDCQQTLISNGTMDVAGLGWSPDALLDQRWSAVDADGAPGSGSLLLDNTGDAGFVRRTSQIVTVVDRNEPTTFTYFARVHVAEAQGEGHASLELRAFGNGCSGNVATGRSEPASAAGGWQTVMHTLTVPAHTTCLALDLVVTRGASNHEPGFAAGFDNAALWGCPDADADGLCNEYDDTHDVCGMLDATIDVDGNSVPDCQENLLPNPEFDMDDTSAWQPGSNVVLSWTGQDALGASDSGSLEINNQSPAGFVREAYYLLPMVPLDEPTTFSFAANYRVPDGQGSGEVFVDFTYFSSGCSGGVRTSAQPLDVMDAWGVLSGEATAPSGTSCVMVSLGNRVGTDNHTNSFVVVFDNVLLHP